MDRLARLGGQLTADAAELVFVSVIDTHELRVYADQHGARLHLRQRLALAHEPWQMCLSPSRSHLYVTLRDDGMRVSRSGGYSSVVTMAVASGTLRQVAEERLERDAVYITTDRSGRFLFTASQTQSCDDEQARGEPLRAGMLTLHRIGADGAVAPGAAQRVVTDRFAHGVAVHSNNRTVFVSHCAPTSAIAVLSFAADAGQSSPPLTMRSWVRAGDVRHLAFHPSRPLLFANDQGGSSVITFSVSDEGGLTRLHEQSTLPEGQAGVVNSSATVRVLTDGLVLATNRGHDSLAVLQSDTAGKLTALHHAPTGPVPRVLGVLRSGTLIAGSDTTNELRAFRLVRGDGGRCEGVREAGCYDVGGMVGWVC